MIYDSILFGIGLSLVAYWLGKIINARVKSPLTNPLLMGVAISVCVLEAFSIPFSSYMKGGAFLNALVFPATAALGLSIYRQLATLKKYWLPMMIGSVYSCICSMASTYLLCTYFGVDRQFMLSLLPKSVTTAVALDLSAQIGGLAPIALAGVVIAGLLGGTVIFPLLMKIFGLDNPIALGVAIGTNSHAAGTARAMEISERVGAISSVCIGTGALVTTVAIVALQALGIL